MIISYKKLLFFSLILLPEADWIFITLLVQSPSSSALAAALLFGMIFRIGYTLKWSSFVEKKESCSDCLGESTMQSSYECIISTSCEKWTTYLRNIIFR